MIGGDPGQGGFDLPDREPDRARKDGRERQHFHHGPGPHARTIELVVGLVCREGTQHREPLLPIPGNSVPGDLAGRLRETWSGHGRSGIGVGNEQVVLHIQGPGRLLGPFQELTGLQKVPAVLPGHRAVGHALEEVAKFGHRAVEEVGVLDPDRSDRGGAPAPAALEPEVEAVKRLPHLAGDLMAHGPGLLAGPGHAGDDRVRIVGVERQIGWDRHFRRLAVGGQEPFLIPDDRDKRFPMPRLPDLGLRRPAHAKGVVEIDVGDPGRILGPLDVPPDPVERLGDAAQHGWDSRPGLETAPTVARGSRPGLNVTASPRLTKSRPDASTRSLASERLSFLARAVSPGRQGVAVTISHTLNPALTATPTYLCSPRPGWNSPPVSHVATPPGSDRLAGRGYRWRR